MLRVCGVSVPGTQGAGGNGGVNLGSYFPPRHIGAQPRWQSQVLQGLFPRDILSLISACLPQASNSYSDMHSTMAEEGNWCQTVPCIVSLCFWLLEENKQTKTVQKACKCHGDSRLAAQHISLYCQVHFRQEDGRLTYRKAHAKGNIGYGIHAAIDWHVAQIHEVAHDGHHGGVHHSWSWRRGTEFRKKCPFFKFYLTSQPTMC